MDIQVFSLSSPLLSLFEQKCKDGSFNLHSTHRNFLVSKEGTLYPWIWATKKEEGYCYA
jgi:hypothetical protein